MNPKKESSNIDNVVSEMFVCCEITIIFESYLRFENQYNIDNDEDK